MKLKISHTFILGIFLAGALLLPAGSSAKSPGRASLQKGLSQADIDNSAFIDVNNIKMWVTNHGSFAWDIETGDPGLVYPKGTDKTAVFSSGLWMGGIVNGDVRTVVAEYSQEYTPGNMENGTFVADRPDFKVYKINKGDGPENPDWVNWPSNLGAPVDANGDPMVLGDQTLWAVFNDADPSIHLNDAGSSEPLGIEVQQTVFGFNRTGALGNTVFIKLLLINKGTNTIDSTYVSLWSDPDLGGAGDDLVGSDTDLSLGYCYNATNNDVLYGTKPPAVGYDFFKGPIGDDGIELPMVSFNKYINGTDPHTKFETYNYMRGLEKDGAPLINPVTGEVTTFFTPGDPVKATGWLDSDPADRRFMLSSGPFTFAPGDTQEVVAAIVVGEGQDRLTSITALKFYDSFAQDAFDKDFQLPSPPQKPQVTVTPLENSILLSWGSRSETHDQEGYKFEGYNIYQGASIAGPWKRVATYDVNNGVGFIFDDQFDFETGVVINKPAQFGSDIGVKQYITITEDIIRGGPLATAQTYYFGVTAYAYNPDGVPKTLENSIEAIVVYPQGPISGTDLSTADADVTGTPGRVDGSKPPTTDYVNVYVVDPSKVTGHDYKVTYTDLETPYTIKYGPNQDEYTVEATWSLQDATTGVTLLSDQWNKFGDDNYDVIDGIQVKVIGSYKAELQDVTYENVGEPRGISWVNWGGVYFNGSADYGMNFFGSALDPEVDKDKFTTVEIRFSNTTKQKAYRYIRGGYAPLGVGSYGYADYVEVPFTVWDVVSNRQLNVAFTESPDVDPDTGEPQNPTFNGTWNIDLSSTGGREYIFILGSTYSDTPDEYYTSRNIAANADEFDCLYAAWLRARSEDYPVIDEGDVMKFTWAAPGTSNDFFTFSTSKAVLGDNDLAREQLEEIMVIPNPYYGHSTYELNQFERRVRFVNLPAKCTIRIFNLYGLLVRTIEKNDPSTSVAEWNLLTYNEIPVASGIYVYLIEAPDIGKITGKMVVFIEKERLNTF